ncbi:Imm51 family immunity protein [Micromonosporaceae bacterium Da 78-11]
MEPLEPRELEPGSYSLWLDAGTTPVDGDVEELGHEPNGYFWEGVARWLVRTEAPALDGRFSYDPEAGAFCAYGTDREALADLAGRLNAVTSDGDRLRQLITEAGAEGFDFDD